MHEDDDPISMNILSFWARLGKLVEVNDLDGFKEHLSVNYTCVDESKYSTAIIFVGDKYEFLHYLIFDCGLKREDAREHGINSIADKLFTAKELLNETEVNKIKIKLPKI